MNDKLSHNQHKYEMEMRVNVTKTIWGCATGMLGICIPLVGIMDSPVIPFAVIAGASLGTAAIFEREGVSQ